MTMRILFTGEGTSDKGLVPHVEAIAASLGTSVSVSAPDVGRLGLSQCHSVPEKLRALHKLGDDYDLIVVHRDSDRVPASERRNEIAKAVATEWSGQPHVAVVPVRMLEAWLLLDEVSIRQIAENPNGRKSLDLPRGSAVEKMADPKKILKETLATASEYTGRRLANFQKRFPQHRQKLLERLDPDGPVSQLASWQEFTFDVRKALQGV
ncbi:MULTISPECIES: DUF4276 family protein [Streptomyces]|uniref:DUF4276 family protein n=1 Tax=Streptomyces TaxID=1883 RepID=UPI001907043E|nr:MULTISPECIES: DUF4276 family protein [unclassified Streptomyces]MCU4746889.1 DUF1804 family protein [Streptomyces sp. G-5]QQN77585.1 DUF4276 family protein [Streptomyces sp. XC 2026]